MPSRPSPPTPSSLLLFSSFAGVTGAWMGQRWRGTACRRARWEGSSATCSTTTRSRWERVRGGGSEALRSRESEDEAWRCEFTRCGGMKGCQRDLSSAFSYESSLLIVLSSALCFILCRDLCCRPSAQFRVAISSPFPLTGSHEKDLGRLEQGVLGRVGHLRPRRDPLHGDDLPRLVDVRGEGLGVGRLDPGTL
jgi:hypothetical protein